MDLPLIMRRIGGPSLCEIQLLAGRTPAHLEVGRNQRKDGLGTRTVARYLPGEGGARDDPRSTGER